MATPVSSDPLITFFSAPETTQVLYENINPIFFTLSSFSVLEKSTRALDKLLTTAAPPELTQWLNRTAEENLKLLEVWKKVLSPELFKVVRENGIWISTYNMVDRMAHLDDNPWEHLNEAPAYIQTAMFNYRNMIGLEKMKASGRPIYVATVEVPPNIKL